LTAPTVQMNPPSGTTPSTINLPDGTTLTPASYPAAIPAPFATALIAAGWSIAVDSGTTHVP
jgi:hypothetical protein